MSHLTGTFTGIGVRPTFSSVTTPADDRVRLHFSEEMSPSAGGITLVGSYSLTPAGGSVARTIVRVELADTAEPTYVDLVLDGEMTIGTNNYTVTAPGTLTDLAGNVITGTLSRSFNGRGTRPFVHDVVSKEETIGKVKVFFSETVKQVSALNANDALRPANYSISGPTPVTVLSVAALTASAVELTVTGQAAGKDYTLTIANVEDLANNAIL
jgi:hypothetical protein